MTPNSSCCCEFNSHINPSHHTSVTGSESVHTKPPVLTDIHSSYTFTQSEGIKEKTYEVQHSSKHSHQNRAPQFRICPQKSFKTWPTMNTTSKGPTKDFMPRVWPWVSQGQDGIWFLWEGPTCAPRPPAGACRWRSRCPGPAWSSSPPGTP